MIEAARRLLPRVEITPTIAWLIAPVCIDAALGHRADIVVSSAARTVRAWNEAEALVRTAGSPGAEAAVPADSLVVDHRRCDDAAELALAHRRRTRQDGVSQTAGAAAERARERLEEIAQEAEAAIVSEQTSEQGEQPPDESGSGEEGESPGQVQGSEQATQAVTRRSAERLFEGELVPVRKIALPRDRRSRATTGKRSASESRDKRGRYVRATQREKTTDIAFDATMRAAAPHQDRRRAESGPGGRTAPPPGAPGPAPEGAAAEDREPDRVRGRRERVDGRRAAHAGDQGGGALAAAGRIRPARQGVAGRVLGPDGEGDPPADLVGRLAEQRLQRLTVGGTTPLTHGLIAGLRGGRDRAPPRPYVIR